MIGYNRVIKIVEKIEQKLENKLIALGIICLITLVAYSNSFTVPFLLDDFSSISNNYAIRNPFDIPSIWNYYTNRFVLYFTLSLNYAIHDNSVYGYHIVNTAIHIFNGVLVFLIVNNILSLDSFKNSLTSRYRNVIATLSALIFTTHPMQVNAVTYIVQRTASLAATFYLLSVLYFIKYRVSDKKRYFAYLMLFILLAML
jgi:hypothetical protein